MNLKKLLAPLLTALLLLFPSILICTAANEDFSVSRAFADNMVLQRRQKIAVWGWSSNKGAKIEVTFKGRTASAAVDANGEWTVYLPPEEADAVPADMTVRMGASEKTIRNILVGDVWFVSGQSNAELRLSAVKAAYPSISQEFSQKSLVRYFDQGSDTARADFSYMTSPQKDVIPLNTWEKETDPGFDFSALGYFFAKKVSEDSGIPQGIICVALNGAPMSELLPQESLVRVGITTPVRGDIIPLSGAYNALLAPFQKMSMKGMIFYQGESEHLTPAKTYTSFVTEYVKELRSRFENDFPFYYVQLSSHGGDALKLWTGIGTTRSTQFAMLSELENSGMVVSMDCGYREGDSDWAHPYYKKPVGERLAALALARNYGVGLESEVTSPFPTEAYYTDEGIVVKFKNVGDGLQKLGSNGKLLGFKVLRANRQISASAKIIGKDTVLVIPENETRLATALIYGESLLAFTEYEDDTCIANLGNSAGLPAPAFRIPILKTDPNQPPKTPDTDTGANTDTETVPNSDTESPDTAPAPETSGKTEDSDPTTSAPLPDGHDPLPETEDESETGAVPSDTVSPQESDSGETQSNGGTPWRWIAVIIAAVAIVGGGIAALFIVRAKKNP